jgi:hypothetical protein
MNANTIPAEDIARTLYEGQLAYYRTYTGGLLKVRISALELNLEGFGSFRYDSRVTVTGYGTCNWSAWEIGETFNTSLNDIVHRSAVRVRSGRYIELWRPRFSKRWIDYPSARELESALEARAVNVVDHNQGAHNFGPLGTVK